MGEQHQAGESVELANDISIVVATHEDGHVVVVLGEGEQEQAFIIHPDLAESLGNELFKAAQDGKAHIKRRSSGDTVTGE